MTQKSKKVGESGKDSPEKSPPSGGESELVSVMSSKEQPPSEKHSGSSEGSDPDQQRGRRKGTQR